MAEPNDADLAKNSAYRPVTEKPRFAGFFHSLELNPSNSRLPDEPFRREARESRVPELHTERASFVYSSLRPAKRAARERVPSSVTRRER